MENAAASRLAFTSSVKADVWHPQKEDKSYEWWYFDALSDDGREAIVVIFLDNFIYSPRYNRESISISGNMRRPAVSFTYFKDGRVVYRSVNEFHHSDFHAGQDTPKCSIGESSFNFDSAAYGSGYSVRIKATLPGDRIVEADLEWLAIESDLITDRTEMNEGLHCWNMVCPRADVTGRITLKDKSGRELNVHHFRGSGYHDHNLDNRWLAKTVQSWHWGRAHFADCTAVFFRFSEAGREEATTKLLIIKDGKLEDRSVRTDEQSYLRDKFGIRYPSRLRLDSDDGVRLTVKPLEVMDSSFYFLRFLSEVSITIDGKPEHSTVGLSEFIAPKTLKYRLLNWLADVRTGKEGKSSYF
jgi:carotenoid 1,2-hydratase